VWLEQPEAFGELTVRWIADGSGDAATPEQPDPEDET